MATRAIESHLPRPVRQFLRRNERSAWKGLVAGAAGGLVGAIIMTEFQNAWNKAGEKGRSSDSRTQQGSLRPWNGEHQQEEKEDATMKTAGKLAHVAGKELTHEERKQASPLIHYGFGMAMGALYGMAMETSPRQVRAQRIPFAGSVFGSALFLGADEMAVPALGLAEASESPSRHLYGWASHLVYGLTAEFVRRQVRKRL
jgi:putative membrane protein